MFLTNWGSTAEEVGGAAVGDDLLPDARLVATRSITLAAPPAEVFPWLRQMRFGRAGWYSYNLLHNLGRRSAHTIHWLSGRRVHSTVNPSHPRRHEWPISTTPPAPHGTQ